MANFKIIAILKFTSLIYSASTIAKQKSNEIKNKTFNEATLNFDKFTFFYKNNIKNKSFKTTDKLLDLLNNNTYPIIDNANKNEQIKDFVDLTELASFRHNKFNFLLKFYNILLTKYKNNDFYKKYFDSMIQELEKHNFTLMIELQSL